MAKSAKSDVTVWVGLVVVLGLFDLAHQHWDRREGFCRTDVGAKMLSPTKGWKAFISQMLFLCGIMVATLVIAPSLSVAQGRTLDLADRALISVFQRDSAILVCGVSTGASLKEMRDILEPYITGVDLMDQSAYSALVAAVYKAFPCPFSPSRAELRPATASDLIGSWIFPDASLKLRHGPKSPSWRDMPGLPPIKCEGVSLSDSGEYRVAQLRGNASCPTLASMQAMQSLPQVSSWRILSNGRLRIDRTDVPAQFEEWEIFSVQAPFEFYSVKFYPGDLVAYLRGFPGNEIGAATIFRHLQALK